MRKGKQTENSSSFVEKQMGPGVTTARVIHTLDPIVDDNAEILILGSMPGVESLRRGEYYAHPRNHFWPILYTVFDEPLESAYAKRVSFIRAHRIALWDVIASCNRKGSSDSTITDITVNDITALLQRYKKIRLIILNGTKAESTFRKLISLNSASFKVVQAPSTSPVPGRNVKTYEEKLQAWSDLLKTDA